MCAIDQRARRDGPVLENLGEYDPVSKDPAKQFNINIERVQHWLKAGAQPSDTVRDLLAKKGIGDVKLWETDRKHDHKRMQERIARKAAEEASKGEKKEEKKA